MGGAPINNTTCFKPIDNGFVDIAKGIGKPCYRIMNDRFQSFAVFKNFINNILGRQLCREPVSGTMNGNFMACLLYTSDAADE